MDMPTYTTLATTSPEPHVLVVSLNRPEVANAINTQMGRDLRTFFART